MTGRARDTPRADARAARAVSELDGLLASGGLPASVRDICEGVRARLMVPVRLSVVGLPSAEPVAIVNDLLEGAVLPDGPGVPPAELTFAETDHCEILTAEGDARTIVPGQLGEYDLNALALLRRAAPVPLLEQVALRVVSLEGAEAEAGKALLWAMRGADMLLWCADAHGRDRALLGTVREPLWDHAFLAVPGPLRDTGRFLAAFTVGPPGLRTDGLRALRGALLGHVQRGRREDLDSALAILEQYQRREATCARAAMNGVSVGELAPGVASPLGTRAEPETGAHPGGGIAPGPARIIDLIAERAADIGHTFASSVPMEPERLLQQCADILAEASVLAEEATGSCEGHWAATIADAADLAVLLQMEASPSAVVDALALMLQVRHACEADLAA